VARISHCVSEAAIGVITGDVGVGKTVAIRAEVAALDPIRHHVLYVSNPAFGTRGLYVTIVSALGASPRFHKAEVMAQAQTLLAAEESERHRRVVFILDEAHLLSAAQLEELRLLTNSEMDSRSPFAAILVGQPMLMRQLRMGMFAALDQRIATRFSIPPMDLAESAAYLKHLSGAKTPIEYDFLSLALSGSRAGPVPRIGCNIVIVATDRKPGPEQHPLDQVLDEEVAAIFKTNPAFKNHLRKTVKQVRHGEAKLIENSDVRRRLKDLGVPLDDDDSELPTSPPGG
jgi:hypothetical protein